MVRMRGLIVCFMGTERVYAVLGVKKPTIKANLDFADGLHLAKEFDDVFAITGDPWASRSASVSAEELTEMHGAEKANALMSLDTSGNGFLEAGEVSSLFEEVRQSKRGNNYNRQRHEMPNDIDQDGKLSRAEIRAQGFTDREVNTIMLEVDDDRDEYLEAHEVLEILAAVDENQDDELSRVEVEKAYPSLGNGKKSILARFLAKFQRFGHLTPEAKVRRFWSVLKDIECICPTLVSPPLGGNGLDSIEPLSLVVNESHRPCLFEAQLAHELEGSDHRAAARSPLVCTFPQSNNSLLLTAQDFREAAEKTLMPIAHIEGDMTYADFRAFIQNEPSHITGAISHLIDANGLIMARSMLLQQLLFEGMAAHFPSLVRDAARKRTAHRISNAEAQHLLLERGNAKLVTFIAQIGVIVLILLMLFAAIIYARLPTSAAWGPGAAAASDSIAEYQIIRAYFIGFLSKSTDGTDDAAGPQPRKKKSSASHYTNTNNNTQNYADLKQISAKSQQHEEDDRDSDRPPPFNIQHAALLIQHVLVRDPPLLTLRDGADAISDAIWTAAFEAGNRDFEALENDPEIDPLELVKASVGLLNERRSRQAC